MAYPKCCPLISPDLPRYVVYQMMDRLLLLRRGEMLYADSAAQATPYFERLGFFAPPQTNAADFYIEVAFGFVESARLALSLNHSARFTFTGRRALSLNSKGSYSALNFRPIEFFTYS